MSEALLKVRELSKSFDGQPAVENVTFDLMRAETLGVVGESGSGKTTLVRCILRAIDPDAGSVEFHSSNGWVDLHTMSEKNIVPLIKIIFTAWPVISNDPLLLAICIIFNRGNIATGIYTTASSGDIYIPGTIHSYTGRIISRICRSVIYRSPLLNTR